MPIGVFALFWMFAVANIASTCRATAWPYLKETLNSNEAPFSSRSPPFLSDVDLSSDVSIKHRSYRHPSFCRSRRGHLRDTAMPHAMIGCGPYSS